MSDMDVGMFKVRSSPDGKTVAIIVDRRGIETFQRLIASATPEKSHFAGQFAYMRDTALGALLAASSQMMAP